MQLPDTLRHGLAAALASAAFLLLYLPLGLIWWAALGGALIVYFALLLIVRRRPEAAEIKVAPRVSAADLIAASEALRDASRQVARAAAQVPDQTRGALEQISGDLEAMAGYVREDPEDFRKTRRFVGHFLPHMLQNIARFGDLSQKVGQSDRLAAIGARIEGYAPAVHRIRQACLENDFEGLELEVATLEAQLARRQR